MLAFPGPEVFEAVVDRIETGVYVVDGKQRVVYWNHGAEKITGLLTRKCWAGRAPAIWDWKRWSTIPRCACTSVRWSERRGSRATT